MFKAMQIDDSVSTCDCCGKTGLKSTVLMFNSETGEEVHFGSVCATRHSGRKIGVIQKEIDDRRQAIMWAVEKQVAATSESRAYHAALDAAVKAGLLGLACKTATTAEREALEAVKAKIEVEVRAAY